MPSNRTVLVGRTARAALVACFLLAASVIAPSFSVAACVGGSGNGTVEAGEQCDDGSSNGGFHSCCTTTCTFASGEAPDVIVGDLVGTTRYTAIGGITAYAIGTTSCNIGNCWLKWYSSIPEHPVIGQNMYRLKNGRFEHIGQSWLKHGFTALNGNVCSASCPSGAGGSHLGVNCSDPYSSSLNGQQSRLGPKSAVNPATGVYPYPDSRIPTTGDTIFKRLQVHNTDLDPAMNTGAVYFVEGQYVTHDDATAGNHGNNASYRSVTVGAAPNYSLTLTGTTQRQKAGIEAWKAADAGVTLNTVPVPSDGFFIMGAKATSLGGGVYHYEYAVQNFTSNRSGQSFSVPIPAGAIVTNVGFHDVDYHSGEPYDGTDWPSVVGAGYVTWSTQTVDVNPNANALRWGTLYNFRFDANVAPSTATVEIGLFLTGSPTSVTTTIVAPGACTSSEGACGDGGDNDCDGQTDCSDSDCCTSGACAFLDGDGDQYIAQCDCNDAAASVYPGAPQLCDGVNNNCSAPGWPAVPANESDADGDGARICGGDCDDANPLRFPGNAEVCDGIDNDCVGGVPANEADADGDGARICGGDCDDTNERRFPGNPEICDGIDNDCAGGVPANEADADGDGARVCEADCDDNDPNRYKGNPEVCDGIDNDCADGVPADEADGDGDGARICGDDCDDSDPSRYPGNPETCDGIDNDCANGVPANEADGDADGARICGGDCDDADPARYPGNTETCDGIDNDCANGVPADEADGDEDGARTCGGDCDDADPQRYPGHIEVCDGLDNDCADGVPADEADADLDGYRVCAEDCDDQSADRYPGNPEVCDGLDNDCADGVPADEIDSDGDGVLECEGDCDLANEEAWATPGEVTDLLLDEVAGVTTLTWSPPKRLGCVTPRYDTLRSMVPNDFMTAAVCVEADGTDTSSVDPDLPPPGSSAFYLVRCENDCPNGQGPLGSTGPGRLCP